MRPAAPDLVAVVGSGVAGLTAAHVLARRARVTLYEADSRLGGHADTHLVDAAGESWAIDTGFIVHNERTYPHLLRLFDELGVADPGVRHVDVGALRRPPAGVGRRARAGRPVPLVAQRAAAVVPADADRDPPLPPPGASAAGGPEPRRRRDPPRLPRARALLAVLPDPLHGVAGRVRLVLRPGRGAGLPGALPVHLPPAPRHAPGLRLAAVAHRHRRLAGVRREGGRPAPRRPHRHQGDLGPRDRRRAWRSPTATARSTPTTPSWSRPTPDRPWRCWPSPPRPSATCSPRSTYSPNTAQLHTDERVLPRLEKARASWNYLRRPSADDRPVTVSYDMTRLQRLPPCARTASASS